MQTRVMRLLVPPTSGLTPHSAARAYLTGPDSLPWPSHARLEPGMLVVERTGTDSVKLNMPWWIEDHGDVVLTTGSLIQRDKPFQLAVELARGKVNQVRNQCAEWQAIGLSVGRKVETAIRHAMAYMVDAATSQHDIHAAAERAEKAIAAAMKAGELLVDTYVEQAIAVRLRNVSRLPVGFCVHLGSASENALAVSLVEDIFSTASVPLDWRAIEPERGRRDYTACDARFDWCEARGLKIQSGPLLRCDDLGLPEWVAHSAIDFRDLIEMAARHVSQVIDRYRGRVASWVCAARFNSHAYAGLTEEQRLQLVVRAFEIAHQMDPGTPAVMRLDQPWGEYLRKSTVDLSPMQITDGMMRAGLPMRAIALEINMGYDHGGTALRDRIEFSRLLDNWSYLGLPLQLTLSTPSESLHDAMALGHVRCDPLAPRFWTRERQEDWVERYALVALTKPFVQSIVWNQLTDEGPHEFPHAGLLDDLGHPKPALTKLAELRERYLAS